MPPLCSANIWVLWTAECSDVQSLMGPTIPSLGDRRRWHRGHTQRVGLRRGRAQERVSLCPTPAPPLHLRGTFTQALGFYKPRTPQLTPLISLSDFSSLFIHPKSNRAAGTDQWSSPSPSSSALSLPYTLSMPVNLIVSTS